MASPLTTNVEIDRDLADRARRVARRRGVEMPQLVRDALEHELGAETQPPFSLIGAFRSGRDDLSERASRDEFESESFR